MNNIHTHTCAFLQKIIPIYLIVMIKENLVENIFNPLVSVLFMDHKLQDMQTQATYKLLAINILLQTQVQICLFLWHPMCLSEPSILPDS